MAATGYSPIQLYYSTTASAAPTAGNLASGELAINITDGKLYYKDNAGAVQLLSTSTTANGTANGVLYLNGSKVATSGSALTFNGTNLTLGANSFVLKYAIADGNGFRIYQDASDVSTLMNYYNGSMVFGIGNSEKMRLTNTGLGIGTSSPSTRLTIGGYSSANQTPDIQITRSSSGTAIQTGPNITFTDGTTNNTTTIQVTQGRFGVWNYGGGTWAERMSIDASGNLGLGVTPSAWNGAIGRSIEFNTAGNAIAGFGVGDLELFSNAYYNSGYKYAVTGTASGNYTIQSGAHKWFTAPSGTAGNAITFTQAMTLDASGRLLVGATTKGTYGGNTVEFRGANIANPGSNDTGNLSIFTTDSQAANVGAVIALGGVYSGSTPYAFGAIAARKQSSTSGNAQGYLQFYTTNSDNSITEKARIDSSGNLGIGTSSPSGKLHVLDTNGGFFFDGTNATYNRIKSTTTASATGKALLLSTVDSGTSGLYLDASGNLGLGVTPSAWSTFKALQVAGAGSIHSTGNGNMRMGSNFYFNGTNYVRTGADYATMYSQNDSSGYHAWFITGSSTAGSTITWTQAMTLDASGNLGLGMTSPVGRLTIQGAAGTNGINQGIGFLYSNGTQYGAIGLNNSSGWLQIMGRAAAGLTFHVNSDLQTTGEAMRIDSSGNLLVGTTSNPNNRRFITSSGINTYAPNRMESTAASGDMGGLYIVFTAQSPNNTTSQFIGCDDSTASRFYVRSNGGIGNYQANDVNLSDRREKTNFAPASEYLSKICAIPVQTFNYIDQSEDDPGLTLGVVAQDVQAVAPELVSESNWGTEEEPKMRLSIYQTDLQYALMKCIQEQQAQIESLRKRLADAGIA